MMGVRNAQQVDTRNILTQIMQGVELPSVIAGREANTKLTLAQASELGDKVTISTSQGPLNVSPDKAMDYAIKIAGLSLDERKVIADESMNAANVKYTNAKTDSERQMLAPEIERMQRQNEFITAQTAALKAETDEYMDVPSPLIGDVDENGKLKTYKIKAKDYKALSIEEARNYITKEQKNAAIANGNAEDLLKITDKLKLIETGFLGKSDKGVSNTSNPSSSTFCCASFIS